MTSGKSQAGPQSSDGARKLVPPPWPRADADVQTALARVYASGDWGRYHGTECAALCGELAEYHSVAQASLCSSGTIAVELALRGLGVTAGDEVLLAAYDFPGNFRAIEAIGARPVLLDVRDDDAQLDVTQIQEAITSSVKAVIASHLHGGLVDMPALRSIADDFGIKIVEDACQCPGAWVRGKPAGTWGDISVMSFGGSKLLTAGRGGALLCDDAGIMQRIKVFRERGNDAFPLSELQAAVLRPQLQKLNADNQQRLTAAKNLQERFRHSQRLRPLHIVQRGHEAQEQNERHEPGYYKFGMWLEADTNGLDRDAWSQAARAGGVALDPGFRGFARRSEKRCRKVGDLHNARRAAEQLLILHHPVLLAGPKTLDAVADALLGVS